MEVGDKSTPAERGGTGASRSRHDARTDELRERAGRRVTERARSNLRNIISDDALALPSLGAIADDIRLELEARGEVAILYIGLKRYGRLERVFGWQVTSEVLDSVAGILKEMVGSSLRRLDVLADFTLSDNAFIVVLSPPRKSKGIADDDLMAISRRVYERLQSLLLNDLTPGVFDRVHPFVTTSTLRRDDELTFEQSLQNGVAEAMEAAEIESLHYEDELERTLDDAIADHSLEPLFEPVVDLAEKRLLGYRTSVRGPFYSPLRLPDVLEEVARRSASLSSFGIESREAAVTRAQGLTPEDLLFVDCAAVELPGAAILALSEFYSLNKALVPQHVVFDLQLADIAVNAASTLRVLSATREMGFPICVSGVGAGLAAFDLMARAQPEFLVVDPSITAGAASNPTLIDAVQLLLRFAARIDARLVACEVDSEPQLKALRRVGVEIVSGEVVARPDTRLPQVNLQKLQKVK